MKILRIIILLSCIGISYTVAQRRQQNAGEVQPDISQSNPVVATRSRGRARFNKTPEFEQVSSAEYAAASRNAASEGRSEGKSRSIVPPRTSSRNSISSTRRQYEVEEHVDDVPDRPSVYHRPRVITEDKFEIPNAPRSKLFEAEPPHSQAQPQELPLEELLKSFGTLDSDAPTKLELPQFLPEDQYETAPSSSSTTNKVDVDDTSSSTTEKEMERELMKKDQSTKRPESSTSSAGSSTTLVTQGRRTIIRTRTNPHRQSSEATSTSATVRTRGRTKSATSRAESVAAPSTNSEVASEAPRGTFRVGRRRPTQNLKERAGPSVIEEDSQSPKTRTGRDSNVNPYPSSRRGQVRNTSARPAEEPLEATTRNRADVRRSRGRKLDTSPTTERQTVPNNKPTEFTSRRTRTRTQPIAQQPIQEPRAAPRVDVTASARSFQEPIRSRSQPESPAAVVPSRDTSSRTRTRSRFQLGDLENVKLEPQQSVEHITRAIPRTRPARTRAPVIQTEELIASSTVENPIRVTSPSTSTIRSVNSIPTRIKETVQSEVSEVVSSRKVTRRKKPEPKPTSRKSQEDLDDLDELNYPPQFKAIILANKSKDERKLDTATLSASLSSSSSSSSTSTTTPSTTTSTSTPSAPSTTASLTTTSTLFQPKPVEDVDNDLAPTRPTRRRFSVSTRKPGVVETTNPQTRKPKTLPVRKLVASPDPEKIAKFHARFNNQYQRNNTRNNDESHLNTSTTSATTKRPTKAPSRLPYTRKQSDKLTERKQIPTKTNRYSSRYRSETRSSTPTRAATTSPVYIPTVPTVTPGPVTSPHQAPKRNDAIIDENDDIKIISIAQPKANSLYSDNLVTENITTVNASDTSNQPSGSILERIINSISSISTSTTKPETPPPTTESSILKIPPSPKKKATEEITRSQKKLTTEKPTTIIERILNSLSAIQASDNNVGTADGINDLNSNLVVPVAQVKPNLVVVTPKSSASTSTTTSTTTPTTTTTTSTTTISSTVKVAPAPTPKPFQSTVAISLVDYLASLGLGTKQRANIVSTTALPTLQTTTLDFYKNTIDYLESSTRFERLSTTTTESPSTTQMTTTETTTSIPSTTTTTTDLPASTISFLTKLITAEITGTTEAGTSTMSTFDGSTTVTERTESSTTSVTTDSSNPNLVDSSTRIFESTTESTTPGLLANALSIDATTPIINVSPNSVTITSPNDVNNKIIENPTTTNFNNRTGKRLESLVEDINNEITSSKQNNIVTNAPGSTATTTSTTSTTVSPEDYFVFAVLPNNTIVRKRPRKISAPYFIVGVYPNNTIVRKFPNGTVVPDDPVVQVSGFDTRDPLPPSPMITSNRVTEPEATDDARENAEVLSIDLNNDTATLTGKTLGEYTSIFNQTVTTTTTTTTTAASTTAESTVDTTTLASVTSTTNSDIDDFDIDEISTAMNIDMTTLNIPMIIELGTTTEEPLVELVTQSQSKSTLDSPEPEPKLKSIKLEPVEVETISTIAPQAESRAISDDAEELEDTTLPMPETSTIVMTSTSTAAETTTVEPSTVIPNIITSAPSITISSIDLTSHKRFRVRLIRRRRPIRMEYLEIVRTTALPTTSVDDQENEIRNSGTTSRVVEVSTTSVPNIVRQTTPTITIRYTQTPTTTGRPSTWFTTTAPSTTNEPNWLSTTQLPTTMFATRRVTTTPSTTTTTTTPIPTTTTTLPPTTNPPRTTTFRATTTTDLTTFIANILSTLRPVYTPTTTVTVPTTTTMETTTTTAPTVTITARRRTTTEQPTTTRPTNARRRTMPTTMIPIVTQATTSFQTRANIVSTLPTTTYNYESTTFLDPSKVDIDQLVKKSKKNLTPQQLADIETLKALEKEQANLLQQLSLLTNLNIGGQGPAKRGSNSPNLANRIVQFAKERDHQTTTESIIYTEPPTIRTPKKLPVLDSKGTTVEDIIKELNAVQNSLGEGNGGKSQEAIIAEILKQRGIEPSTPKSLSDAFRTTTTRRPRPPTTARPGRIMQGLNWLLTQFAGPEPAQPAPAPRPRPTTRKPTTTSTTTSRPDYEELHYQSTEVNNVIQNTPTTRLKRPVNSLSDAELTRLITQLEAIQRDPQKAQNLDLAPFRKLQQQKTTTLDNKNVEIITTGGGNQVTRGPKSIETVRVRTAKSTTSNSIEDLDEDNEVPSTTARSRTTRPTRARVQLPPVELNHVPGIEENSQGPQIGGNFLNAAVNVTRAISTFLGAAIQGAAQSFQSVITSGSSATGGLFRASG